MLDTNEFLSIAGYREKNNMYHDKEWYRRMCSFLYERCMKTVQESIITLHNSRSLGNLINNYYLVTSCSKKNPHHKP